jgi:tetratricopeptide (TPR) repeat protein
MEFNAKTFDPEELEAAITSIQGQEGIIDFFEKICPAEGNRSFELAITKLVKNRSNNDTLKEFDSVLHNIRCTSDTSDIIKYAAFYAYVVDCRYNRKEKNFKIIENIFGTTNQFKNYKSYMHLTLEWLNRVHPEKVTSVDVDKAKEDWDNNPNHPGIIYLYGSLVATLYENNHQEIEATEKHEENLKKAYDAVTVAIKKSKDIDGEEYTKFYSGKSRLLYLQGNFKEALDAIDFAIKHEPHREYSTSENMRRFLDHKLKILIAINAKTTDKMSKVNDDLDNLRKQTSKNIEFLGLFAGIIALVVGSLQMAANQPASDAIKLIIVLFGSLLSTYAGFGIILHGYKKKEFLIPSIIVMALGLCIIIAVLLFLQA